MDSISPNTKRTTGNHTAVSPDVPKFTLGTMDHRRGRWLGFPPATNTGARTTARLYRRSDHTPTLRR